MGPVQLEVADLLLDLENPGIVGAKSQRDALQKIVEDQKEKLLVLARSIVEDEGMNPMDRLLVLKAKDGFTVLEGNRRLAALKILSAPSTLDDVPISTGLRRAFAKLAERFDRKTVEPLPCFEIANREDGVKWLHQRHTGENGGKGVVVWSGIAASRLRGQDPALQTLAYVTTHGDLTEQQTNLLADFPITTLDRLLSSREVRSRLGFDVKNGKLVSGLPPEELLKPLRQIGASPSSLTSCASSRWPRHPTQSRCSSGSSWSCLWTTTWTSRRCPDRHGPGGPQEGQEPPVEGHRGR